MLETLSLIPLIAYTLTAPTGVDTTVYESDGFLIKNEKNKDKKLEMKKNLDNGVKVFVDKKKSHLKKETEQAKQQTANGALNKFFNDTMVDIQADSNALKYYALNVWDKVNWGGGQEADQGLMQIVDGIDEKLCNLFPELIKDKE